MVPDLFFFCFSMILNLMSETAKSYDISQPLQEINESVRLAFLNSFLDFAGTEFF
jgi:exocyst complex component 2